MGKYREFPLPFTPYLAKDMDCELAEEVSREIKKLESYFNFLNREKAPEAMLDTFYHCLKHYKGAVSQNGIAPYLKKLASTILKKNSKEFATEFVEDLGGMALAIDGLDAYLENSILDTEYSDTSLRKEVINIAFTYTQYFLLMCEQLIDSNYKCTKYFPAEFKNDCLRLVKVYPTFNTICLDVYKKYGDELRKFLAFEGYKDGRWFEADYDLIAKRRSKRIKVVSLTDEVLTNLDVEDWILRGSLAGKHVYKIDYISVWNKICDMFDSEESNCVKLIIEGQSVYRTLGGSTPILGTSINVLYDLSLAEIITTILRDSCGLYLGSGTDYLYIVTNDEFKISTVNVKGVDLNFYYEDITDWVVSISTRSKSDLKCDITDLCTNDELGIVC